MSTGCVPCASGAGVSRMDREQIELELQLTWPTGTATPSVQLPRPHRLTRLIWTPRETSRFCSSASKSACKSSHSIHDDDAPTLRRFRYLYSYLISHANVFVPASSHRKAVEVSIPLIDGTRSQNWDHGSEMRRRLPARSFLLLLVISSGMYRLVMIPPFRQTRSRKCASWPRRCLCGACACERVGVSVNLAVGTTVARCIAAHQSAS